MTANELRKIRERLRLTQEGLGKRLGYTRATINAWENGREPIPKAAGIALEHIAEEEAA